LETSEKISALPRLFFSPSLCCTQFNGSFPVEFVEQQADWSFSSYGSVDPALALKLASVKSGLEVSLADERSPEWWSDASTIGLVGAGLTVVARWLSDKLVD
jgi:hypothetical protein